MAKDSILEVKTPFGTSTKSKVYELDVCDIEQLDLDKQNDIYKQLAKDLVGLEEGKHYKFYKWNRRSFINYTSEEAEFSNISKKTIEYPLDEFLFDDRPISDITFENDHLVVGNEFWAFLEVESLPSSIEANFLEGFSMDYVVEIKKHSKSSSELILARKQNSSDKLSQTYHRNSLQEKKYRQAEDLKEKIEDKADSLFSYSITFIVKHFHKDLLEIETQNLVKELKNNDVSVIRQSLGTKPVFEKVCIGGFGRVKSILEGSGFISNLLPLKKDLVHKQGVEVRSFSDKSILLDVFDSEAVNPHMFISGATGTGKSSFTGYYVYSYIQKFKSNAIFIDLGGGLKRISSYLGGEDFSSKIDLGLFGSDVNFIRDFIIAVIGGDKVSRIEKGIIYECIEQHFNTRNELKFEALIEELELRIKGIKYYFVEYKDYFVVSSNMQLPKICYVDTAKVPDELLTAYLVYIRRLADKLSGKTFIVWDECWKFAEKASYAVSYAIKTDRKKDISNIFINQEYDKVGLEEADLTDIILSNVNFKLIFDQGEIRSIKSSTDKQILENFIYTVKGKYSFALLKADGIRKILKVTFDPFFYELTMTEKKDLKKQQKFIERHCEYLDFKTAFDKWISFKYDHRSDIYV